MLSRAREQLYEEIRMIPANRLPELYQVLHYFRLGVEKKKTSPKETIMKYAGAWNALSEESFQDMSSEMRERRKSAFGRRRNNATGID